VAAAAFGVVGEAEEREIVGFRRAGGEDHFVRIGADERGHLPRRRCDRLGGAPTDDMLGCVRIAESIGERSRHFDENPRIDRGRRLMIQIDSFANFHNISIP